jgi:hypothetical protein
LPLPPECFGQSFGCLPDRVPLGGSEGGHVEIERAAEGVFREVGLGEKFL